MAHKTPTPAEEQTDTLTRRWESAIRADVFGVPDMGPESEEPTKEPTPHCPSCGQFQGAPPHGHKEQ